MKLLNQPTNQVKGIDDSFKAKGILKLKPLTRDQERQMQIRLGQAYNLACQMLDLHTYKSGNDFHLVELDKLLSFWTDFHFRKLTELEHEYITEDE